MDFIRHSSHLTDARKSERTRRKLWQAPKEIRPASLVNRLFSPSKPMPWGTVFSAVAMDAWAEHSSTATRHCARWTIGSACQTVSPSSCSSRKNRGASRDSAGFLAKPFSDQSQSFGRDETAAIVQVSRRITELSARTAAGVREAPRHGFAGSRAPRRRQPFSRLWGLYAQDVHHAGEIIGEHRKRHLGGNLWQRFHQKGVVPIRAFMVPKGCFTF